MVPERMNCTAQHNTVNNNNTKYVEWTCSLYALFRPCSTQRQKYYSAVYICVLLGKMVISFRVC